MSKRPSITDIASRKNAIPLVMLTCYSAPMAALLDGAVDLLLVGDSLGMVVYGMESTVGVSLELMIAHGKAVAKTAKQSLVVVDMPFGSYQQSKEQAFASCAKVLAETGASAVKLEGGAEMAETIAFLVARGIAVMGHVGLMPQRVHALGGYRYQGRNDEEAAIILNDAKAVADAGAFCMVIEGVKETLAEQVTREVSIPTIGIGASRACDGQVLVLEDMLGLSGAYVPGFVKRYANLGDQVKEAVARYAGEVRKRDFPSAEYTYPLKKT